MAKREIPRKVSLLSLRRQRYVENRAHKKEGDCSATLLFINYLVGITPPPGEALD